LQSSWSYLEYDSTLPAVVQPQLNYQAPECILASSNGPPSDIFALGILIYTIHSSEYQPLQEFHNDFEKCRRFLENFKGCNVSAKLLPIPDSLRDTVKLMLSHNPELRLDAHQFIKVTYF